MFVAGLTGYLAVDLLFPRSYPRWLVWAFAPLTGFGICSIIVFLFRRPMFTVEAVVLVALLFFWFRSRRASSAGLRELIAWRVPLLGVLFVAVVGCFIAISVMRVNRYPHGLTDAWAIWDSHARFMVAGGPTWEQDLQQHTFHP